MSNGPKLGMQMVPCLSSPGGAPPTRRRCIEARPLQPLACEGVPDFQSKARPRIEYGSIVGPVLKTIVNGCFRALPRMSAMPGSRVTL